MYFIVICPWCSEVVDQIPVEEGETWNPAVLWGYVAQKQHEELAHP